MYVKLVNSYGTGSTATLGTLESIRGLVGGTITSTSQLNSGGINQGLSIISGTPPTTGIYTVSSSTTSTTYDGSGNFTITKFHYAKGQNSGAFTPSRKLQIATDRDYGWRFQMYDSSTGNGTPNSNASHFWASYDNTSYDYGVIAGSSTHDNGWKEMHFIINDTTFVWQVITTGADTQVDYGTMMMSDLEYSPTFDNYAYSGNSRYCPTPLSWWYWANCMERGEGLASSGANNAFHGVANPQFIDQFGTYRNTELSDGSSSHYGNHTSGHTNLPNLEPQPRNRIYQIPVSSGNFAHQLVPLTYKGHQDDIDNFGDPRRGRLMNCYRTSDGLGWTGDVLTEGSTDYRLFRVHKSGDETMNDSTYNACYAFPEDNIPF